MAGFEWTDNKIRQLKTYYSTTSNTKLAEFLGCPITRIAPKAKELGLKKTSDPWTAEQDDYLRKHYATKDWEEMMEELDRNDVQITSRANRIGLKRVNKRPPKPPKEKINIDTEYVSEHYNGYNLHPLAEKFDVTPEQMYAFIKKHKINRKVTITKEIREKRKEIAEELNAGKTKTCPRCGTLSLNPIKDYTVDYGTYDALNRMCTSCRTEYENMVKALKPINRQIRKEKKWLKSIQEQEYKCKTCNGIFKGGDMSVHRARLYVTPNCKSCYNKHQKEKKIERMLKKAKGE
jgi:hypothetical protein